MNNSQNKNLLTEGSIWKKLMGFAFPLFLGNLFQQLYNTADSLIVGNFLGSDALAAVSSSGSLTFLLVGFFQGLAMGAGVIIARYFGARQKKELHRAIHTTVAFGILCGILLTAGGVVLAPKILILMKTPADILPKSTLYHKTNEAIARPFDRWIDMTDVMQRIGVTDLGIWQSHYLRGFNYIDGARYDDGETNPVVLKKTLEVFQHMNSEYVLNNPKLNKKRKRRYLQALGIDYTNIPMDGRLAHFAHETVETLRVEGPFIFIKRVWILFHGAKKHPKRKPR